METYRILPRGLTYRVEAIAENGTHRLIEAYQTERAAMERLRDLRTKAEVASRRAQLPGPDWRG
jgi:hypothetical protein